jgi:hypothetical protein
MNTQNAGGEAADHIEQADHDSAAAASSHFPHDGLSILVNGEAHRILDPTPTGRQVLGTAGLTPVAEYVLLLWPTSGPTTELGLDEVIDLQPGHPLPQFLARRADRLFYFILDDDRFAWAGPLDEATIRRIGRIPEDRSLWLQRRDQPDLLVEPGAVVDLTQPGVERIFTRRRFWKLDVQGAIIESEAPHIEVKLALEKAGIDPSQGWIIILKVKGQPKRQIQLNDQIDLTQPGIERLRLTPKQINNGEGPIAPRRQFALLPKDEAFLNGCGYYWETVNDGRRWLIIGDYPLPQGYRQTTCKLAIEIPPPYPAAELDMFYCNPPLSRINGGAIPQTESSQTIEGVGYQRWSRHRQPGQWSPQHDCVATHLGLVEESVLREVNP